MQFLPSEGATRHESYYFYGQYYAAQAMWQAGGQRFGRWYPAVRDELIGRQHTDGSWITSEGNECATAMACIVLRNAEQLFADFSAMNQSPVLPSFVSICLRLSPPPPGPRPRWPCRPTANRFTRNSPASRPMGKSPSAAVRNHAPCRGPT